MLLGEGLNATRVFDKTLFGADKLPWQVINIGRIV